MLYEIGNKDKAGTLITMMRVIREDLAYLKQHNKPVDMNQYPHLETAVKDSLFKPCGALNKETAERIEKAGIQFSLETGHVLLKMDTGAVRVPV